MKNAPKMFPHVKIGHPNVYLESTQRSSGTINGQHNSVATLLIVT